MKNEKYTPIEADGNAFAVVGYIIFTIMNYVVSAMKCEGKTKEQIEAYCKEAMSSDYRHLLAVSNLTLENLNE